MNHADTESAAAPLRRRNMKLKGLGVALTASAFFAMSAIPAWAADMMTVTFIRHAQSYGNLSGLADSSTPGPVLTNGTTGNVKDVNGVQQARDIVKVLGDNNYDGIYASQMVRTQLTAAPMSQYLGLPIQVLPGLQEIEGGKYEGTPEAAALFGYFTAPLAWAGIKVTLYPPGSNPPLAFGQITPDLTQYVPGGLDANGKTQPNGPTGEEFEDRVNAALQTIYDSGDRNAAVFSHGGTIMTWTMMNAMDNLTFAQKIKLFTQSPLSNTNYVVVEGNPEDGWTLANWNGQQFTPEKTYFAVMQTQLRTLNGQLSDAWQRVATALSSGDFTAISTAINRGIADASFAFTKYNRAMKAQNIKEINKIVATVKGWFTPVQAAANAPAAVSVAATGVNDDPASASSMLKQLDAPVAAPQSVDTGDSAKAPVASKADEPKVEAVKAGDTKAEGAKASKSAKADKAKKTVRRAPQKAAAHASAGGEG